MVSLEDGVVPPPDAAEREIATVSIRMEATVPGGIAKSEFQPCPEVL